MKCPTCNGNAVGKIGVEQFYCWNCFVEFSTLKEEVQIYQVAEDGSLHPFNGETSFIAETNDDFRYLKATKDIGQQKTESVSLGLVVWVIMMISIFAFIASVNGTSIFVPAITWIVGMVIFFGIIIILVKGLGFFATTLEKQLSKPRPTKEKPAPKKNVLNEPQCPICGSKMYMRTGPYGSFLGCSRFPSCRGKQKILYPHGWK
jgi:Topoisomerase DNA binding C4 zinc finger